MNFIEGEILYINKPLQWTSFNVVNKLRWKMLKTLNLKKIKVGHAGTLDPLASGVLIVCTGKKTRHIDTFTAQTKEYIATLKLGQTTPSFDLELPVDKTFPTEHIDFELVSRVVPAFTGEIWQEPPVFSAVKIDGKRAYDYARRGEKVEIQPKLLKIDRIEILEFAPPFLTIRVECSKGTYIRALARDIGVALGSGAHLVSLQRVRIGKVRLEDCMEIEEALKLIENECIKHKNINLVP
ncbi:MAG: tRNA pseudouridine(55) synthase TruB [Prevotellaceae bacterium]|nr:tRNA pseudouridine(55) synthase TruB [Prevotellaceae bacterium]